MSWDYGQIRSMANVGVELLFHVTWIGALVGGVTAGMDALLRKHSARIRYAVLTAGILLLAVLPLLTGAAILARQQTLAQVKETQNEPAVVFATNTAPKPTETTVTPESNAIPPSNRASLDAAVSPSATAMPRVSDRPRSAGFFVVAGTIVQQNWAVWICVGYALVCSTLLLNLSRAVFGGKRLCQRAVSVVDSALLDQLEKVARELRLRVAPRLAYSAEVTAPTVIGVWRATVLLPLAYASSLTLGEMEVILLHELAHIRRHDFVVNLVQRVVEAIYFYHPMVWWLSYRLRVEREFCCDDLVVEKGTGVERYATALLRVAELAQPLRVKSLEMVGVQAVGSPSRLRHRVARLLGEPHHRHRLRTSSAWPLTAGAVLAVVLGMCVAGASSRADSRQQDDQSWGKPSGGLQMRIVAVAADADEQHPELAEAHAAKEFSFAKDVTLLVELKNTSDKPIQMQGVRYGETVSDPWVGRSNSKRFAPELFTLKVFNQAGDLIEFPRGVGDIPINMISLSGGRAEEIMPGGKESMLLRPLVWDPSILHQLKAGKYELELTYHGTPQPVQDEIARLWPKRDLADVWWGAVMGPRVSISIETGAETRPELQWGKPKEGIRTAVEYRLADRRLETLEEYEARTFPLDARIDVTFHFENVSEAPVEFKSFDWIQESQAYLVREDGTERQLSQSIYSGIVPMKTWRIKPGQIVSIPSLAIAFSEDSSAKTFKHPIGPVIEGKSGRYRLRHQLGERSTGVTELKIRARTKEDDPPEFEAQIQFDAEDGGEFHGGFVEVRPQQGGQPIYSGEVETRTLTIMTSDEPLHVHVRMRGYEEADYYNVRPSKDVPARFSLIRAKPVRFQLTDEAGEPVGGARVRRFNRSKEHATSDPLPIDGNDGPVYAVSQADGTVVLDSLRAGEPEQHELGGEVYWFVIEHDTLADHYIGPVKAGSDLGQIKMSPPIRVTGTILGTPAELDRFQANQTDYDQPVVMRPDVEDGWSFARSRQLVTKRTDKGLTFQLTGLRPGKLRIVGRFSSGQQGSKYVSGKREPFGDDLVWEFDLREAQHELVLSRQNAEANKSP